MPGSGDVSGPGAADDAGVDHGSVVSFGDRLAERVARRESQLVLGLDPDPERLWPGALERTRRTLGGQAVAWPGTAVQATSGEAAALRAAHAVAEHCRLVIDAVGDQCVAVKLQVACFERLGPSGWAALGQVVSHARAAGLLVIADAKRGDVAVSATAYAQTFFGQTETPFGAVPGLGVDALTVSPWLGADALEPLVAAARSASDPGALFVLIRNSNPGAAELQDLELAGGGSVSLAAARMVARLGRADIGRHGLSDIGAVVGATVPQRIASLREAMPHAIFLIPGVGAQGGRVEDLTPAFGPGPASALISASRAIVYAHEADGGDPAASATQAAARLRESVQRLLSPRR